MVSTKTLGSVGLVQNLYFKTVHTKDTVGFTLRFCRLDAIEMDFCSIMWNFEPTFKAFTQQPTFKFSAKIQRTILPRHSIKWFSKSSKSKKPPHFFRYFGDFPKKKKHSHFQEFAKTNEPRHDKTNKMSVRPAKTQISLGIRLVWSESSLCAQWVAKDPGFLHADSEDSAQADLSFRWAHTHVVDCIMSWLKYSYRSISDCSATNINISLVQQYFAILATPFKWNTNRHKKCQPEYHMFLISKWKIDFSAVLSHMHIAVIL